MYRLFMFRCMAFDASRGPRVLSESGQKRVDFDQMSKRVSFTCRCCITFLAVTTQTPPVGLGDGLPKISCPVHGKDLMWVMAFDARELFGHHPAVDAGPDLVDNPREVVWSTAIIMAGSAVTGLLLFRSGVGEFLVSG